MSIREAIDAYEKSGSIRRAADACRASGNDPMVACYIDSAFPAMLVFAYKYADSLEEGILASANAGGEEYSPQLLLQIITNTMPCVSPSVVCTTLRSTLLTLPFRQNCVSNRRERSQGCAAGCATRRTARPAGVPCLDQRAQEQGVNTPGNRAAGGSQ